MEVEKAGTCAVGYFELANKHRCPECGGRMAEVERVNENGFSFVWYECMMANCDGQWLEKKAALQMQ
jgi:hypothetical protein